MAFPFQEHHGWMLGKQFVLNTNAENSKGDVLRAGTTIKCVMISRFGDCGITTDLTREHGYSHRVMPSDLEYLQDTNYDMIVPMSDFFKTLYGPNPMPPDSFGRVSQECW